VRFHRHYLGHFATFAASLMLRRNNNDSKRNDGLPTRNGKKLRSRRRRFVTGRHVDSSNGCHPIRWLCYSILLLNVPLAVFLRRESSPMSQHLIKAARKETGASVPKEAGASVPKEAGASVPKEAGASVPKEAGASVPKDAKASIQAEAPIEPRGGFGYPNECTSAELEVLKRQLPTDHWIQRLWRDASFTVATKRSEYPYNPILMRQFYASDRFNLDKDHAFYGVLLNVRDTVMPFDTLAIGSRDTKVDSTQFSKEFDHDLKPLEPIEMSGASNPARVFVIEWDESPGKPAGSFQNLQPSFGMSEDQLSLVILEKEKVFQGDVLPNLIREKMPKRNGMSLHTNPIHYLDIACSLGCYNDVLYTLRPLWKDIRYIHFEYNKNSYEFKHRESLSNIIEDLKTAGLICYFAGKKESDYGLWRITGCFLDYYNYPHWSEIACVNVLQDDVKTLVSEMENKFQETLKKEHEFVPPYY